MLLKQHLDMIGRNEPIQRKAKFWQSYVRALKDDPLYLQMDATEDHERRMEEIDELLPLKYRYPQYYRPSSRASSVPPMPHSAHVSAGTLRAFSRARSATPAPPHLRDIVEEKPPTPTYSPSSYRSPLYTYTGQKLNETSFNSSKEVSSYSSSTSTSSDVTTKKTTTIVPIYSTRVSSNIIRACLAHHDLYSWPDDEFPGEPLYHRPYFGSYVRRPLTELFEPNIYMPRSRITRDPWWWDYPTLRPLSLYERYPYTGYRVPGLRYVSHWWRNPYYLKNSTLSPIKRTYLWSYQNFRPFCKSGMTQVEDPVRFSLGRH